MNSIKNITKSILIGWVLIACSVSACEYGDDPRLETDAEALIEAIHSGKETGQVRMTLATYVGLGANSKNLFLDHILISSQDCKPIGLIDGEIIGRVTMPFEDFYRAIAEAIRKNKPKVAKLLMEHGKVSAIPIEQYVDLFAQLPVKGTGGLKVREQMKKIFPATDQLPPHESWLKDQAEQGRIDDYTMAKLFKVFGGQVTLDKGCGDYALSKNFWHLSFLALHFSINPP